MKEDPDHLTNSRYQRVGDFFNRIAGKYALRIFNADSWFGFPYNRRTAMACESFDPRGKKVLDIGCGAGAAYSWMKKQGGPLEYFGCDLSKSLLDLSEIPLANQFEGDIFSAPFAQRKWDVILLIGVAAYLNKLDLRSHLEYIADRLQPNGMAIISFTNDVSWTVRIRHLVRKFIPGSFLPQKTIGLPFQTSAYSLEDIYSLLPVGVKGEMVGYIFARGVPSWLGKQWAPEWMIRITNCKEQ